MNCKTHVTAQLVMKRADGRSFLDLEGPVTAGSPHRTSFDVPADRVREITRKLEGLGFSVDEASSNTLSISGDESLFSRVFGLDAEAAARPGSAGQSGAAVHATRISDELEAYVADVFVAPPPDFYP